MIDPRDRVIALSELVHARDRELAEVRRERDLALADLARLGRENNEMCDERFQLEREIADLKSDILDLKEQLRGEGVAA